MPYFEESARAHQQKVVRYWAGTLTPAQLKEEWANISSQLSTNIFYERSGQIGKNFRAIREIPIDIVAAGLYGVAVAKGIELVTGQGAPKSDRRYSYGRQIHR